MKSITFRAFIKIMERETLLFISMMLLSCILLPTFVMLLMTFFSDIPRTESIFHGYRYLFESFGGGKWVVFGVAIGPYALFQCIRTIRWVMSAEKQSHR